MSGAETWNKRGLLGEAPVAGIPHQGFGRAMKVGREEIAGLITALQDLRRRFGRGRLRTRWSGLLDQIEHELRDISGHACDRTGPPPKKPLPLLGSS